MVDLQIFGYVKSYLEQSGGEQVQSGKFPFRKRSEHIWRVCKWVERLMEQGDFGQNLDRDSLELAAVFHDIGYAYKKEGVTHAESGAAIFRDYAQSHGCDGQKADFITHLIRNHSNKELLADESTPLELIILMEADLLDETGALGIVWDCMMEGACKEQSYIKALGHIKEYSGKMLQKSPMRTEIGKQFWAEKQALTAEFIRQLGQDLDPHQF